MTVFLKTKKEKDFYSLCLYKTDCSYSLLFLSFFR